MPRDACTMGDNDETDDAAMLSRLGLEPGSPKLKILASRTEEAGHAERLVEWLTDRIHQPDGPLLA